MLPKQLTKIILGGFTGVIAIDMSELCFYALDYCVTDTATEKMGANVLENNQFLVAKKLLKEEKKAEQQEEKKKEVWKRGVRLTLLLVLAMIIGYVIK